MMAGANRDTRIIQYGGGVVRMHPVDVEADDSGAVFRPVDADSADARERRTAFRDQRAFVRVNRVEAEALRPVDGSVKPDGADDVRSARFEPHRSIEVSRLREC